MIRRYEASDRALLLSLFDEFYHSPAVLHPVPAAFFEKTLNAVQAAMLETNGQISFLPKSAQRPATAGDLGLAPPPASLWYDLVLDGKVMPQNLRESGRDESWLRARLHSAGIGQTGETFYAACDAAGNFFACRGE